MSLKRATDDLNAMQIREVGAYLGIALPRNRSARCPLPGHEDTNPSFSIYQNGTRWKCFACNEGGGTIDFVMAMRNLDFKSAKTLLSKLSNYEGVRHREKIIPAKKIKQKPIDQEKVIDFELYESFISKFPLKKSGKTYLLKRSLSLEVVKHAKVCQISNETELIAELINEFGFPRVKASGVLTRNSNDDHWRSLFSSDSIVFPFFEAGRPVYLQSRTIKLNPKYGRWRNLNFHSPRIYNSDVLNTQEYEMIAICEGVIDCLSAVELGLTPIGLTGVSKKLTADEIEKFRGKTILILFDWDVSGDRRAKELQDEFKLFGISAIRKKCPANGVKDLNDYLMKSKQDQ